MTGIMVRFECGVEDRFSKEYGPYPFVQQTYAELRFGPDGEILAFFDAGNEEWLPLPENRDLVAGQVWYTDVIIYPKEVTSG